MLVNAITFPLFGAAVLAVVLAASAWRVRKRGGPLIVFFVLLSGATFLWTLGYGIELNLAPSVVLDASPIGSWHYVLYIVEMVGLAATPTYWFLFAAAYARKNKWLHGWRFWLAHTPMILTIAAALTNPIYQLYVTQAGPGAPTGYGPMAIPSILSTYVLVGWGIWLLVTTTWRRGTPASRREAVRLGLVTSLIFIGGFAWALRHPLSLPLPANPVPVLFVLLNAVLLYEVLRGGLIDLTLVAAQQTFRTISDAVLVVDNDSVLVALNPAAERLLPEAHAGRSLHEIADLIAARVESCLEDESECLGFESSIGDGMYWGRVRRTLDRQGLCVGCIVVLTDVTELREAQAQLAEVNGQLRQRVLDLEEARARAEERGHELVAANALLEEATRAKSQFLGNVSHELRTPMNSILGFSGTLMQGLAGPLDEEVLKQVQMINVAGKRLLALINRILDLTKIESGKELIELEPTDLQRICASVVELARPSARERGIDLALKVADGDLEIVTDASRVEQILTNLVDNAIKFSEKGGVTVAVVPCADSIEVSVTDSGVGIPEDAIDRVFAPFERVEQQDAVAAAPGTGLGLSISHNLALLLGGSLAVQSALGQGSTFTLELPRRHRSARTSPVTGSRPSMPGTQPDTDR